MKKLLPLVALLLFAFAAHGQNANVSPVDDNNRPLKVKKKPHAAPGYCSPNEGVALVRTTFDKSGKVTGVALIKPSGCNEFDERALAAARRISFEPALKNGEAVTVVKTIEYAYHRY